MTKDQSYGGLIFVVAVLIAIGYLLALITRPPLFYLLVGVPVVLAVLGILGITAWIGWTMLTTPPPTPLESEMTTPSSSGASAEPAKPEEKKY